VSTTRPAVPPASLPWLLVLAAIAVSATSLRNAFAYDDLPLIVENVRVTTLSAPWTYLGQSYWPAGGLHRPLTVFLLALQWHLGGGAPWVFHALSVIVNAIVTVLVYRLARCMLDLPWAALAALLFAAHPVHVEAVANVVGQSELLCTGFVLGAVLLALKGVSAGFTPTLRLGVLLLGLLAALSKEQGFVTPALILLAAGLATDPPGAAPVRRSLPIVAMLGAVLLVLLLLRTVTLGGMAGDQPAAPLIGLDPASRVLVALGTVPAWTRLLFWPARLSFDYSPPGYAPSAVPAAAHLLAAVIVGLGVMLAWTCRTRARAVTLGMAWGAIALFPVSNLAVPTGVLLAERTLYLASVGAVMVVAGAGQLLAGRNASAVPERVTIAVVSALILVGAFRSAGRARVWRDNDALMGQIEHEASTNYRARRMRGLHLERQGRLDQAEAEYRRSIALWGHDPKVYLELATLLQRQGRDTAAAGVLRAGLAMSPDSPAIRSKLYYLLAGRGIWPEARSTAAAGLAMGDTMFAALVRRADSGIAAAALPPTPTAQ
jgi:tetratricopeptide (TPR) repeat protein